MEGNNDDQWETNYAKLVALKEKFGQAVKLHRDGLEENLYPWLRFQLETLNPDVSSDKTKLDKLATIGYLVPSLNKLPLRRDVAWESKYRELEEFHKLHKHCHVARSSNKELHNWIDNQKALYRTTPDTFCVERKNKLLKLGILFVETKSRTHGGSKRPRQESRLSNNRILPGANQYPPSNILEASATCNARHFQPATAFNDELLVSLLFRLERLELQLQQSELEKSELQRLLYRQRFEQSLQLQRQQGASSIPSEPDELLRDPILLPLKDPPLPPLMDRSANNMEGRPSLSEQAKKIVKPILDAVADKFRAVFKEMGVSDECLNTLIHSNYTVNECDNSKDPCWYVGYCSYEVFGEEPGVNTRNVCMAFLHGYLKGRNYIIIDVLLIKMAFAVGKELGLGEENALRKFFGEQFQTDRCRDYASISNKFAEINDVRVLLMGGLSWAVYDYISEGVMSKDNIYHKTNIVNAFDTEQWATAYEQYTKFGKDYFDPNYTQSMVFELAREAVAWNRLKKVDNVQKKYEQLHYCLEIVLALVKLGSHWLRVCKWQKKSVEAAVEATKNIQSSLFETVVSPEIALQALLTSVHEHFTTPSYAIIKLRKQNGWERSNELRTAANIRLTGGMNLDGLRAAANLHNTTMPLSSLGVIETPCRSEELNGDGNGDGVDPPQQFVQERRTTTPK